MAFGKKYFSSYKSNNNLDYYLEIFLEDYTGSALELVMGAGGPVIEYETDQEDRFSPIISSSCKIPYLVENYLDSLFIDDLRNNYQERQVYVHIYRSTQSGHSAVAPLWSGFLVMDIGSGVDKYFPYEEHLKFVDGLSLLKDIDFVDLGVTGGTPPFEERVQGNYAQENMYFGPATYIYWIREILAKSGAALTNQGASQNYGFTTSVNWYNGEMNATGQSSDPLHKTKCAVSMFHRKDDQGVFYPDNCYNVLKELLRHWGARITYWKHEFWIVQIPEYITNESGTISTPVNNNSRLYSNTGAYQGSQNHLGSTYYTRYEQTIQNDKISKLSGTKYDYLPLIKQVNADFLSFSSKSYYGGFPFGGTATTQEVFQGTINSPSAADFLFLSIPLDWTWDLSNAPNFPNGHTNGWWCAIKFNFYAAQEDPNTGVITTYYLQYDSGTGNYFWVDSANWTPLGNRAPKYIISSKLTNVYGHIGFEQQIPFVDENGNAISMSGAWNFFLDIDDYGTGSQNPGSFYLNFSRYGSPQRMRNPGTAIQLPAGSGVMSGTVSWSNTLVDQQGQVTISSISNPAGFNAGTVSPDIRFATTSPFIGLLQTLNNAQSASNGETFNVINSNTQAKQNSEQYNFGTLLWGDSLEFAPSSLQVFNGSTYVNTEPSGEWGRGILTGTKTFTAMLIDEFFSGQTKIIISPSMRLAVGVANKNEDQGGVIRPRYVNPIGKLRETRDGTDPEYFFRRGSFYTLLDEWDYEGYQIIRDVPTTTTQSNGMGSMGCSQSGSPASSGMSPSPMAQALSQNSPLAYIRTTIPATGSNVAVNGNFNTAVGWSLGTGWSIDTTAKKAKFAATGSTSELTQSVLTQGLTYQVNFQVEVTAGTLLVKAGTSGTSQSITSSGDYSIYLDCEGSSLIKFQAGTTFTGNITYITLKDQKSLSSVPIEAIGSAVFKTGDTFNLINSNDDTILPLTVTSNQGSGDTTISVSSTPLYEDIDNGSYLLINQDDLSEQYQNKTKGTVGGFDITATSIDSGSVAISSYIDDDTFATASVNSLATSESIKAYVDGQAGHDETLQQVTDNGNTTTNSIMIGSSSSPNSKLQINVGTDQNIGFNSSSNLARISSYNDAFSASSPLLINGSDIRFTISVAEKMRLTSGGKLGIGTSSPNRYLTVNSGAENFVAQFTSTDDKASILIEDDDTLNYIHSKDSYLSMGSQSDLHVNNLNISTTGNVGIGTTSPSEKLHVVGDALITGDSHADAFKPAVAANPIKFKNFASTEVARITDGGNLLVGGTVLTNAQGWGKNLQIINSGSNGASLSVKDLNNEYNLATYGANFFISAGAEERLTIYGYPAAKVGQLSLPSYGSGTFTGTETYFLAVTSSGDVVEADSSALPGGPYLPLTGGTLSGSLTGTTATFSGRATFNGDIYLEGANKYIYLNTGGVSGLWQEDNFDVRFGTNNSEKMRLTSSGNLLIGTTTDSGEKLVVNGNAKFADQVTIPATPVASTDAASKSYVDAQVGSADTLQEVTDNGNTTTNSIMIGSSSSPVSTLDVDGTITLKSDSENKLYRATTSPANGTSTNTTVLLGRQIDLYALDDIVLRTGTSSSDDIIFFAGNSEKVRMKGNGNVGIGTTSPSAKIVVSNSQKGLEMNPVGGTNDNPYIQSYNRSNSSYEDITIYAKNQHFNIGATNAMTIKNNRNVLIGTTTDYGGKLNIHDGYIMVNGGTTSNTNREAVLWGRSQVGASIAQINVQGDQWQFGGGGVIDTSPTLILDYGDNSATFSGNVLIGTTTDNGEKLQVEGKIKLSSWIQGNSSTNTLFSSNSEGILLQTPGNTANNNDSKIYFRNSSTTVRHTFDTNNGKVIFTGELTGTSANFSGNVSIGGTAGAVYKLDIVGKQRVQSVLELEDVLTLNAISTPSDPASGKSSIYMDSADGAIKVKINVGGTVVTRTIASYE